jgi:hypothetical protein
MEYPSGFENAPVKKEDVIDILKSMGPQDSEAIALLGRFTDEREAFFQQEGREDARLESLREKAHALNEASCFAEAIGVMQDVAKIARNEGDTESHEEALWIMDRLKMKLGAQNPESVVKMAGKDEMISNESGEKVSREDVLDAFKKLIGKGTDPADLDDNDPEVKEANRLFERWSAQQESEAQGEDASLRYNFEKTMLFVDAGFHDPGYLKDILGWLFQDAEDTKKDENNSTRVQLRKDMADAMRKIRRLLGSNQ